MQTPRGIRNNNPGNLRKSADKWQGLAENQSDAEFFTFKNPIYGIRAIARTLITYQDKHDLHNISQIIARYAPANENNTQSYVDSVAKYTGFSPEQKLNMHDYQHIKPLLEAIIRHENGIIPYSQAQIIKALTLAGIEENRGLEKSRTIKASKAAAVSTSGIMLMEGFPEVKGMLSSLLPHFSSVKWALLVIVLLSIFAIIWARYDDYQKGLR